MSSKNTLRTLKDIEKETSHKTINGHIVFEAIKAKAIEWIDKPRTLRMNANDFILVFFDITEEDLQ